MKTAPRFSLAIVAILVAFSGSPAAQAATIPTISGTVRDTSGNPVTGVMISADSGGLVTSSCTDAGGQYRVQTKPNRSPTLLVYSCNRGDLTKSRMINDLLGKVDVATTDVTLDLTLPKLLDLTITVKDDQGNPVVGAWPTGNFWWPIQPTLAFSGATNYVMKQELNIPKGWENFTSDSSGRLVMHLFAPSVSTSETATICENGGRNSFDLCRGVQPGGQYTKTGLDLMGDHDDDRVIDGIGINYQSGPGVDQREWIPYTKWSTGQASVVLLLVPSMSTQAPATAVLNSTVTVSTSILASQLQGASSPTVASGPTVRKRSSFVGQRAKLYSRIVLTSGKKAPWKFRGSCKYSSAGKCQVRLKITGQTEYQFRPVGYTASVKGRTVKVRK